MLKQRSKLLCGLVLGSGLLQSIFSSAHAESFQVDGESRYLPVQTSFVGEVRFEPRYTRVHHSQLESASQHSEKYWSLVIESSDQHYVFNKELNVGLEFPPPSVEIGGVALKPGAIVRVDGQVLSIDSTSHWIVDVQKVHLIAGTEWICHSTHPEKPNLNVRIGYHLRDGQGSGAYHVLVEQTRGALIDPIATVNEAKVALQPGEFVLSGSSESGGQFSREAQLELHIETTSSNPLEFSSSLRIEMPHGDAQEFLWAGMDIPLHCSQSTLSAGG